ncbi:MAG: glycosyltransferase, partial [Myxococcales bacterium]|nr:glycosyltransferase [Myxococcales bacterium]
GAGEAPRVVLFGLGLGELAEALLCAAPERRVVAWDRDPWLMRQALARRPALVKAVAAGRLELALGVEIQRLRDEPIEAPRIAHPLLGEVYALERVFLARRPAQRHALLVTGELFVDDVAATLREQLPGGAFDVLPLEPDRWSLEELSFTVQRFEPQVVFAVNHREGMAEFCARHEVPLVVWEIDPSLDREVAPCPAPGRTHVFTWRAAHVAAFERAGFPSVHHLPLAGNPKRRQPPPAEAPELAELACDVSFVGSSLRVNAEAHRARFLEVFEAWPPGTGRRAEAEAALDEVLAKQEAAERRWILPELLRERFGDFLAAWETSGLREDPVALVAESAGARHRAAALSALAPFAPRIWGDTGWRDLPGAQWMGPAGHRRQLSHVYAASRINIDVGRPYQPEIVTMRVFDALLCGGFVLAEDSEDLHQLFHVGVEVESWSSFEELAEKTARYLAEPKRARAIAAQGRQACLERHTLRARIEDMLAVVGFDHRSPVATPGDLRRRVRR